MNRQEIAQKLNEMGLPKGAIVLLHSSLAAIGKVDGGADAVVDAFLDAVGPEGTLLVPVFGNLGIITTIVKNRPNALVSPCPVGTLAGIGPAAAELFEDHWKPESPHAQGTPFHRLAQKGGFVCLLGVDQDRNTALHGIEAQLKLPYLGQTTQTFTTPDGETVTKTWKHYPGPHRNFIGLDPLFLECGAMTIDRIGNAQVRLLDAKKMWDAALEYGTMDPAFVLCDNPNCPACVRQRADIFSDYIAANESFKLSASARLAGRYVPEMVENLKRVGIKFVELDIIQGVPVSQMSAEKLQAAVSEFNEAGIEVSAARIAAVPDNVEKFIEVMKAAAIGTLIVPSAAEDEQISQLQQAGFNVVICNRSMTGAAVQRKAARCGVNVCFNPANFAEAGQQPFGVYRADRFIRNIVQLDVNDALKTGEAEELACGQAEIKEMISILRCRNFDGFMTIGGGFEYPGILEDAVDRFAELLENM